MNVTIGGVSVAEGCPPGNINNAIRQIAADGKEMANTVGAIPSALPLSGGTITGNITRSGKGVVPYWDSAAQTSGRIFIQASGGAAPSMSDGDTLYEY